MRHREDTFTGLKDFSIYYQCWLPEGEARAVLLVAHGYAEHSGRYGNLVDPRYVDPRYTPVQPRVERRDRWAREREYRYETWPQYEHRQELEAAQRGELDSSVTTHPLSPNYSGG